MAKDKNAQSAHRNEEDALVSLINAAASVDRTSRDFNYHSRKPAIRAAEKFVSKNPISPKLRMALEHLLEVVSPRQLTARELREYAKNEALLYAAQDSPGECDADFAKMELLDRISHSLVEDDRQIDRLRHLLSDCPQTPMTFPFETAEPWARAAKVDIDRLPKARHPQWSALLSHIQSAKGSKPSAAWLKKAQVLVDAFGRKGFHDLFTRWLPLSAQNRTDNPPANAHGPDRKLLLSGHSELTLKGLAWVGTLFDDSDVVTSLGDLGEACWRKIYWYGPRSTLAGNAVLWALAEIAARGQTHAVAQLTRINGKLKHASARTRSDRAMSHVATETGKSRDELEEIAVPVFDLVDGRVTRRAGAFTLVVAITPRLAAELSVNDAAGKPRKSIPAKIKTDHSEILRTMKRTQKDLQSTLIAQRSRIEAIFRDPDRRWRIADWQSRYATHPLLSHLASRLIWRIHSAGKCTAAMFRAGHWVSTDDSRLSTATKDSTISLWHPSTDTPTSVSAWRQFLQRHEITQPFKQAHREVYLLTDAERRTDTYSNRFAAHIIRQHQFSALCLQRGWTYRLQGNWDSANTPTLAIPIGYKAEFWVEQIEAADARDNQDFVATSGVAVNLTTDQVRIYRTDSLNPLPLCQVPPQIFSEIMRDVDLFVGVCSVANDPTWSDGGPDGRFRDYWQTTSFGDLSASAQTRREVLTTLLPRLAIVSQCSLSDKFLRVQGAKRAYKIHLGSGNILMEPNDQYLCIVPDSSTRASTPTLFLPFEGDNTLAIILSKAFLLAADHKITDPSITRQISPP